MLWKMWRGSFQRKEDGDRRRADKTRNGIETNRS